MTNVTLSFFCDEAERALSPQFLSPDTGRVSGEHLPMSSPTLADLETAGTCERPSSAPSELSLIVALAAELEASEARARRAESALAAHGRHCMCSAADIAAEEISADDAGSSIGIDADPSMAGDDGAGGPASDHDIFSLAA